VSGADKLTAQEAADLLGISKATLYSYVSRGLIHSVESGAADRTRLYARADVLALQQRKAARRNPAQAAARALDFGDPVLESAITLIADGRLFYRGHDALELAATRRFEEVASWLWLEDFDAAALFTSGQNPALPAQAAPSGQGAPVDTFQQLLLPAGEADLAAHSPAMQAVAQTGVRLLRLFTWCITGALSDAPTAQQLHRHWSPTRPDSERLLDTALILCADHELNISAFTARCIASAGASPYLAVEGALCALRGYRHGGNTQRVDALFNAAAAHPAQEVGARLKRGEALPGFGHPLYPDGDPRGRLLLDMVSAARADHPQVKLGRELVELAALSTGQQPNIDFALVVVSRALALPPHAPLTLFALGRLAGWIGQIGEQYAQDRLIRPRALYVGK
jgi:citrate synthase